MSETPKTSRAPRAVAASLALALGATGAITAGSVAVADDAAANTVTVRAGDGWWVLAQRAGMSQSALAAANGMTTNTLLHPGMTLRTTGSTAAPRAAAAPATAGTVTVRAGEGWYAVARRAGMTAPALASANGMSTARMLHPGMTLRTSGTTAAATTVQRTTQTAPAPVTTGSNQQVANTAAALAASASTFYMWGGTGPRGFDCSGLTQYAMAQAGKSIPRTAHAQYLSSTKVARSQAQPGDLIFWANSTGRVYHTGVYLGNGRIAHALNPSQGIMITGMNVMSGSMLGVVGRY